VTGHKAAYDLWWKNDLPLADAVLPDPNKDNGYDISDFYGVDPPLALDRFGYRWLRPPGRPDRTRLWRISW
jgi:hypothetical protein